MATSTSLRVLAVLSLICVTLCAAGANAQAKPKAKPTKAQLKAELNKMANTITKRYPQYAKYAKDFNKYIGLALNSKYDFSTLADATILLPSNTEAEALASKKIPAKSSNIPTIYNITAYHIIGKKYTVPNFRTFKKAQPLRTQLKQALYKISAKGANVVSFAKVSKAPAAAWTTIKVTRIYAGPYFIAHGVDKVMIPPGTKWVTQVGDSSGWLRWVPVGDSGGCLRWVTQVGASGGRLRSVPQVGGSGAWLTCMTQVRDSWQCYCSNLPSLQHQPRRS
ncbi:unnamed protein product [Closterium sp. Naga37s-1]|nr:unnamed protein product [Closterium sp. Naga37s-1]